MQEKQLVGFAFTGINNIQTSMLFIPMKLKAISKNPKTGRKKYDIIEIQ